jgi:GrpB-like predicted nucleotidyltransferase (UPF0157 family)
MSLAYRCLGAFSAAGRTGRKRPEEAGTADAGRGSGHTSVLAYWKDRLVIEISDYDPSWPDTGRRAAAELIEALPGRLIVVEHVGSTSVPGLAAKPVIDLMAATLDLDQVTGVEDVLAGLGYRRVATGMPGRLLYRRTGPLLSCHLHVVTAATWDTRNERLLRDHLLGHDEDRDAYARLKRDLATTAGGGDEYTRGKTALIQRMVDAARTARGLPLIDVWED